MMKVVKIKGLCSRPLQQRILEAGEEDRSALLEQVAAESEWMVNKMQRKGYELEAVVGGFLGIFTRGPARGTLEVRNRAVSNS